MAAPLPELARAGVMPYWYVAVLDATLEAIVVWTW